MQTPWGKSDYRFEIERGVNWVGTPSHGGLVVTELVAQAKLTPEAIAAGERYGSLICYEEDCAYAIPLFEVEAWRKKSEENRLHKAASDEERLKELYHTVTVWCHDYLVARGLPPCDAESERQHYVIYNELESWRTGRTLNPVAYHAALEA